MSEAKAEQNSFDPKALIEKHSLEMKTSPDADGNKVLDFSEFVSNNLSNVNDLNENDIELLKTVYHKEIYNLPRPNSEPFNSYQKSLEDSTKEKELEESKIDISKLEKVDDNTYFNPSKGEFFDLNNKVSDFYKNNLDTFIEFRKKYSI